MDEYKVIFIDLDNTLFSFDEMYKRVSHDAIKHTMGLNRLGTEFEEFYSRFRMIADQLYFDYEKGKRSMDSYRDERWKRAFEFFNMTMKDETLQELNEYILMHYLQYVRPYEGAKEFLTALKERYQLGLITNGPVDMQTKKLEKMDFIHFFDPQLRIFSEAEGVSKPEPKIFYTALKKAGAKASEALHIGDSLKHDIAGANAVGMGSALIHSQSSNDNIVPTFQFRDFFQASSSIFLS